jgi:hypothetical protein
MPPQRKSEIVGAGDGRSSFEQSKGAIHAEDHRRRTGLHGQRTMEQVNQQTLGRLSNFALSAPKKCMKLENAVIPLSS